MNQDQINSLIRSLLKIAGSVLVARGLTVYANIVNTEDVAGLLVGVVGLWQSHEHHGEHTRPACDFTRRAENAGDAASPALDRGLSQSAADGLPPAPQSSQAVIPSDTLPAGTTGAPLQSAIGNQKS
jgi:hypothetical protein